MLFNSMLFNSLKFYLILILIGLFPSQALAIRWKITSLNDIEATRGSFFLPHNINSKGIVVGEFYDKKFSQSYNRLAYWSRKEGLVVVDTPPGLVIFQNNYIDVSSKFIITDQNTIFAILYSVEHIKNLTQIGYLYEYNITTNSGRISSIELPPDLKIPPSKSKIQKPGLTLLKNFNKNGYKLFAFKSQVNIDNNSIPMHLEKNGIVKSYRKTIIDYRTDTRLFDTNHWIYGSINALDGQGISNAGAVCSPKGSCQLLPYQRFRGFPYASANRNVIFGTLNNLNAKKWYMPVRWVKEKGSPWRYQFLDIGPRIKRMTLDSNPFNNRLSANVVNKKGWVGGGYGSQGYSGPFLFIPQNGATPHTGALEPVDLSSQFLRFANRTMKLKGKRWDRSDIYAISECGSFLFEGRHRGTIYRFMFEPKNQGCS
jgi:hypothetical protein